MGDVRTFVDEGLGHSSYLIDLGDGGAAIVDPPRFPIAHLATARALGAVPRWTIDTHSHADYVTGSPGLVTDHGVTFVAPAASRLETPTTASPITSASSWAAMLRCARSARPATRQIITRTSWSATVNRRQCSRADR